MAIRIERVEEGSEAAVLGLAGGLFGLLVRVGQQGQRRPGGEDEHQQERKGALFCFHRPAPLICGGAAIRPLHPRPAQPPEG